MSRSMPTHAFQPATEADSRPHRRRTLMIVGTLVAAIGAYWVGRGVVHEMAARTLAIFIIAVESVPQRQELAKHFGADEVIDFTQQDPVQAILDLTGGQGVDASIEALGAQATFAACIEVTRPGGTISNVGYHGHGEYVQIPRLAWGVGMSDHTIRTALCPGGKERMQRLLRLLEMGRVDPTLLTTHPYPFAELARAFHMMQAKKEGIIKPLLLFAP